MTTPDQQTVSLLTARDLAKALRISVRTLWRHRSAGRLPAPIRIGRAVRWDRRDIGDWLEGLKGVKPREQ